MNDACYPLWMRASSAHSKLRWMDAWVSKRELSRLVYLALYFCHLLYSYFFYTESASLIIEECTINSTVCLFDFLRNKIKLKK